MTNRDSSPSEQVGYLAASMRLALGHLAAEPPDVAAARDLLSRGLTAVGWDPTPL